MKVRLSQDARASLPTTPTLADPNDSDGLPEGWVRTIIGQACELNPPKPPADALPPDARVTFVPMTAVDADAGAITAPDERTFAQVRKGYTAFRDDDVIMAKITPCMENGKAAIARGMKNGLAFGSTEFHVLRPNGAAIPDYLFYFIRQQWFRSAAEAEMQGAVGQRRVPAGFLERASLPLSPLAEQRRIVKKIEELLAQVNASRERLARVPAILRRFRQSVLAAACSGRLTADWRDGNEIAYPVASQQGELQGRVDSVAVEEMPSDLPDGWEHRTAGEFYADARYGTSVKSNRDVPQGVPILRIPNIARGVLDLTDLKYAGLAERDLAGLVLQPGDVLVCRTNGSLDLIGKAAVVHTLPGPHAFASYLIRLRLDHERLLPEYLHLCLTSPLGRDYIEDRARTTAGQYNLNLRILRDFLVPVPPVDEQREIIRRVAALHRLAEIVEQHVARATVRADRLTQAILAKAFRGELIPTEAELARREGREYEPASALLDRIRAQRQALPGASKARRRNPQAAMFDDVAAYGHAEER